MGKSSVVTQVTETVDNSAINGLAGVRGNNNITQVLDADAISGALGFASKNADVQSKALNDAFAFGKANADTSSKAFGDVMGIFGGLANKAFDSAAKQTSNAMSAVTEGTTKLNSAISTAQTKLANSGIDPQVIVIASLVLAGVIVFVKRKG